MASKHEFISTGNGYWVKDGLNGTPKQVITQEGEVVDAAYGMKSVVIMKPEVGVDTVVAAEDISAGGTIDCTIARGTLDYPRNLLYTLTDDSGTSLVGVFTTVGIDQFGEAATETVTVTVATAAAVAGTQVFAVVTSVSVALTNAAASDTADVGMAIAADVASFGIPADLTAITDVKSVNWIDSGTSKTQNIDATSVVLARNCFRPEQTVAAADDYVIHYLVSRA